MFPTMARAMSFQSRGAVESAALPQYQALRTMDLEELEREMKEIVIRAREQAREQMEYHKEILREQEELEETIESEFDEAAVPGW